MKAIVDTNVVAYYLLGTVGFAEEAGRFFATLKRGMAPVHWEAEIANVIWMATRSGVLPPDESVERLILARRLGIQSMPTRSLCQNALLRSIGSGISVYDTLFVELAYRERCPLVTFDKARLKAFADIASRPGIFVSK